MIHQDLSCSRFMSSSSSSSSSEQSLRELPSWPYDADKLLSKGIHEKQRLSMHEKKAVEKPKAGWGHGDLLTNECSRIQESYWNLQLSCSSLHYHHSPLLRLSGHQKHRHQLDQATVVSASSIQIR